MSGGLSDLFDKTDLRDNCRIFGVSPGEKIQLVSSTASMVYVNAVKVVAGEKYKVVYTINNIVATSGRQACISEEDGKMIYWDNMVPQMQEGYNEYIFTAQGDGYLWITVDKGTTDIHCYKV